jgi:hypothetical protein
MKMRKRLFYGLGLCIILFCRWSSVVWAGSNFCPIDYMNDGAASDLTQKEATTQRKNYSVPRNQVLLEIGTATW